ncbi:MAG: hypothetical protein LAO09_20640, partial [Acidobacteriia bacterium]|nr:hypothetical protein [Terriglobia bacterium]
MKFKTQLLSPDAKAAIHKEWDEHLRIVHPRQWEREERKRARRTAQLDRSQWVKSRFFANYPVYAAPQPLQAAPF